LFTFFDRAIAYRKEPHGCQFDGSYAISLMTLKQQCIRQTDSREVLFDKLISMCKKKKKKKKKKKFYREKTKVMSQAKGKARQEKNKKNLI
jgi:hypothetical protein